MLNEDRIYRMYQAERAQRGHDSNYYVNTPAYNVARRFKITCAQVREIVARRHVEHNDLSAPRDVCRRDASHDAGHALPVTHDTTLRRESGNPGPTS